VLPLDVIIDAGAKYWQIQLTVAMGNAVDNDQILLQPYELTTLMPLLADLHLKGRERNLLLLPGNNIGYFGPYEALWRGPDRAIMAAARPVRTRSDWKRMER